MGPDLAFGSMIWLAPDGSMSRGGYVVEDGIVRLADSADVVTWLDVDGVTHRGGELVLTFGAEERRFVCRAIDGWLNEHHDVAWVDELCEVTTTAAPGTATSRSPTTPAWARPRCTSSLRAAPTRTG